MSKYVFKVEYDNKEIYKYLPKEISEDNKIHDLDFFSMQYNLFGLEERIKKDLNNDNRINRIVIINTRKPDLEFNLVNNNEYLKKVPKQLEKTEVLRDNHKEEVMTIKKDTEVYKEMKTFLYNTLKTKKEHFFTDVYNRDNHLSSLLKKYLDTMKQGAYSEEDQYALKELDKRISDELSIYKTFRGVAVSRSRYNNQVLVRDNRRHEDRVVHDYATTINPVFKSEKEKLDDINQEGEDGKEEFLDIDEYIEMAGGEDNEVIRRY